MSETSPNPDNLTDQQFYEFSRAMLGESQITSLGAFDTEEYLQRTSDGFRRNPDGLICNNSQVGGGNAIIGSRRAIIESRLRAQNHPELAPRASGFDMCFRIGFGLVERTVVGGFCIDQAEDAAVSVEAYDEWLQTPRADRVADVRAYLHAQDADLLARNLLEPETDGTMANFAANVSLTVPRVASSERYNLVVSEEPEAREQIVEGTLAALFLLREHHIAQQFAEVDVFSPESATEADPAAE